MMDSYLASKDFDLALALTRALQAELLLPRGKLERLTSSALSTETTYIAKWLCACRALTDLDNNKWLELGIALLAAPHRPLAHARVVQTWGWV
jgi:hypothetical protein